MRLILSGHDAKYAVEQILLTLFPEEKVEFADASESDTAQAGGSTKSNADSHAVSRASFGGRYVTISTEIGFYGKSAGAVCRADLAGTSAHERKSRINFAVKRSFYLAALKLTGIAPPWGALTGIRPAKIAAKLLDAGKSPAQTINLLQKRYFVSPEKAELCLAAAEQARIAARGMNSRDISLYAGIPFCPTRCVYCSFVSNSVEISHKLIQPYLEALDRELSHTARIVGDLGLRVRSVYIGGGTPTVLTAEQLDALLSRIGSRFQLNLVREYTVEAGRPDTMSEEKLAVLRSHGVTRVSVNPQSMQNAVLEAIGRRHTAGDVEQAVRLVRKQGFPVLNMDTIAGLPGDSAGGFTDTLDRVAAMRPENIMVHTLALKKGAALSMGGVILPGAEEVGRMIGYSVQKLTGAGYRPYYLYRQKFMSGSFENTGWCLPGFEGLYNIYIMEELHSIVSVGAGAVTKLVDAGAGLIQRVFNPKYPQEYIAGIDAVIEKKQKLRGFYLDRGLLNAPETGHTIDE